MGVHRTCGEPDEIKKNTHPIKHLLPLYISPLWHALIGVQDLGQVIKIPQQILGAVASLVSSVSILLGKSPSMLMMLYVVLVLSKVARQGLEDTSVWLTERLGLDKALEQKADTTGSWYAHEKER